MLSRGWGVRGPLTLRRMACHAAELLPANKLIALFLDACTMKGNPWLPAAGQADAASIREKER